MRCFSPYAISFVLMAGPALAEDAGNAHYRIMAIDGGFVRLDTVTGDMLHCRNVEDAISCKAIAAGSEKSVAAPAVESDRSGDEDFDRALGMAEKAMRSFMAIAREDRSKDCAL